MSEDLIYDGKKASRLHKRVLHGHTITALWTGMRVHLLKDGEMILQECFSARSKRVVTFVIPAGEKRIYLHSSQINRTASKILLALPSLFSPHLQDPRF